jgi:hypothetical protein
MSFCNFLCAKLSWCLRVGKLYERFASSSTIGLDPLMIIVSLSKLEATVQSLRADIEGFQNSTD